MMVYALDTNIISYALKGNTTVIDKIKSAVSSGCRVTIPLIAYYEVKRGLLASGSKIKLAAFENLCNNIGLDHLAKADMNSAAIVYAERKRQGHPIEDSDLLIAAQAITHNYTLVTNNVRHFKDIRGLTIENWVE